MQNIMNTPSRRTVVMLAAFFASIVVFLLVTPIRLLETTEHFSPLYISSPVGMFLYLALVYYICKKNRDIIRPSRVLFIILLGFLLIQSPARIFDFKASLCTLPEAVIHMFGMLLGYLCYKKGFKDIRRTESF